MEQSPYFSGHGGVHSPNPAGAAQMISSSNAAMAAGIMKLSDEISGALRERGKKAKKEKKDGDFHRKALEYIRSQQESEGGEGKGILPGFGHTKEEISNLSNLDAGSTLNAILMGQKFKGEESQRESVEAGTGLTGAREDYLGKQIGGYDESEGLRNQLTEAQITIAQKSVEKTDLDINTQRATLSAVADMATMPRPYGAMDDAEAMQMKFASAIGNNSGADASVMLKAHNDMIEAAKGPFKPEAVSIPLPDGTTGVAITTSRSSAQVLQLHAAAGGSFKKIKDEDGKVVAIGIPDGKGGFISSTIKHLKDGYKPSDFDVDGDGWLKGSEFTDFRVAFSEGNAMNLMFFDAVFPGQIDKEGNKGLNIGLPPKKKKSSKKPNVPGTAAEVKSKFEQYLKDNP
jgi:hypothetical protein